MIKKALCMGMLLLMAVFLMFSCTDNEADSSVAVGGEIVSPEKGVEQSNNGYLQAGGAKRMVCSLSDQRLYFFEGDQLVNVMRCSTGVNDSTPIGEYSILNHHPTHGVIWGEICDWWMGFTSSHGVHSWPRGAGSDYEERLGKPASPGCITLHPLEAYWPYNWAPNGTPLNITWASLSRRVIQGCHDSMGVA
ncbi:MAG: L,D-transpeptidase, partial [Actinomycetota bacterium]|nr:L,D-transpeptidase [Actinomycetota bacterium]